MRKQTLALATITAITVGVLLFERSTQPKPAARFVQPPNYTLTGHLTDIDYVVRGNFSYAMIPDGANRKVVVEVSGTECSDPDIGSKLRDGLPYQHDLRSGARLSQNAIRIPRYESRYLAKDCPEFLVD